VGPLVPSFDNPFRSDLKRTGVPPQIVLVVVLGMALSQNTANEDDDERFHPLKSPLSKRDARRLSLFRTKLHQELGLHSWLSKTAPRRLAPDATVNGEVHL